MGWTSPVTWTAGHVPTAAELNQQLRDNIGFLHSFHGARVYNSAVQAVTSQGADTSFAAITFDTESFDTDGFHSTVSTTSRFTIPSGFDGFYLIRGQIEYAANATGVRSAFIRIGGTTTIARSRTGNAGASVVARVNVAVIYSMAATQYVELGAEQNSASTINVDAGLDVTFFEIAYLGA